MASGILSTFIGLSHSHRFLTNASNYINKTVCSNNNLLDCTEFVWNHRHETVQLGSHQGNSETSVQPEF